MPTVKGWKCTKCGNFHEGTPKTALKCGSCGSDQFIPIYADLDVGYSNAFQNWLSPLHVEVTEGDDALIIRVPMGSQRDRYYELDKLQKALEAEQR